MRRWLGVMAGCALLALSATGCHHTAGVCDCDPGCADCGTLGHYSYDHLHHASAVHPVSAPLAAPKEVLMNVPK
jgi:hypothetical protein